MRRSFGSMGMGGGSGGRGIIKNVHGAIRAGTLGGGGGGSSSESPPFSTTTTTPNNNNNRNNQPINTALSLSSNTLNHPLPAVSPPYSVDDSDWECIYDDHPYPNTTHHDFGFGSVPSQDEVHHAFSSLQQYYAPIHSLYIFQSSTYIYIYHMLILVVDVSFLHDDDEYGIYNEDKIISTPNKDQLDWTEPSFELLNSSSWRSQLQHLPSSSRVYDAFHLMQTDPSVQRMVISLSSDKAVWDAVMNNEVVRELGVSIAEEDKLSIREDDDVEGCNPVKQVLRWMFVNTKDKVVEIVERITKIVNDLVQQPNNNKEEEKPKPKREGSGSAAESFQEKLRSAFFLSIMVLFIVVVTRGTRNAS
ncbi:hypothetical protein OSB04_017299 [Centaurea solstitialis]|uniref:Uncharacterized protein n=1 Tax=Centaurea solstitialis TaxID=347529 RepID=A0AA38T494_9ASTR|nr:hypothetical protein OSB04_017299 [Centaurea solstitialis]